MQVLSYTKFPTHRDACQEKYGGTLGVQSAILTVRRKETLQSLGWEVGALGACEGELTTADGGVSLAVVSQGPRKSLDEVILCIHFFCFPFGSIYTFRESESLS